MNSNSYILSCIKRKTTSNEQVQSCQFDKKMYQHHQEKLKEIGYLIFVDISLVIEKWKEKYVTQQEHE